MSQVAQAQFQRARLKFEPHIPPHLRGKFLWVRPQAQSPGVIFDHASGGFRDWNGIGSFDSHLQDSLHQAIIFPVEDIQLLDQWTDDPPPEPLLHWMFRPQTPEEEAQ